MTRALYHEDGTALEFSSVVTQRAGQEVALEATAFYPEGGGQPDDRGVLRWANAEAHVLGTRKDKASGLVWHTLDADAFAPAVGTPVTGEIDPARRWRHMQRHSAEHLLAQAFQRVSPVFQVAAVSMLGPECHLDLLGDPGPSHIREAEERLRAVLGRDELTLSTPVVPDAELHLYPLRRESKVSGQVRLVIFSDPAGQSFDVSACGGTHVPRAAMCAPVVILRTERIKGGLTRVTFMAGEEASAYLSGVYQQARSLAQRLSVPVERLTEQFEAQAQAEAAAQQEIAALRARLAAQLRQLAAPEQLGGLPVRFMQVDDAALLLPLLSQVGPGEVLVALGPAGRCGVASGAAALDAGKLLRDVLTETGGKGGGRPELAQGSAAAPGQFFGGVRARLAGA